MSYNKVVAWIGIVGFIVFLLLPVFGRCDEYIDYCFQHPDHKALHVGLEMLGSAGMYGVCRSAFDDGRKYDVSLDDCRKITIIFGTLAGAIVETTQMEDGERPDFAIRDILVFNTMGILLGIGLVDIIAPLGLQIEDNRLTMRF